MQIHAQKVSIQVTLAEEGEIRVLISPSTLAKFKQGMKEKCHDMFKRHGVATAVLHTLL